jgi:CubicO group peptidase (beta-lactamase class C family)
MVARKGKVIHSHNYGFQDIEKGAKVEDHTIFRIYSMSKPITAVAMMILYEQGKFQLNDKVSDFIPAFKQVQVYKEGTIVAANQSMTIKHLLTHTSGLGYGWGQGPVDSIYRQSGVLDPKQDLEAFSDKVAHLPLYHEPGSKYLYGISIDILGRIVEVLSGQTFDAFLAQNIFDPLGMDDTGFYVPEEKLDRFMEGYQSDGNGGIQMIDAPRFQMFKKPVSLYSGGGGMVSTMHDYMRFAQMLLNGGQLDGIRILSRKTVELMTADHHPDHVAYKDGYGFGFAMEVVEKLGPTDNLGSVGEYRWSGMANTYFWIDPKEELIGMVFTQFLPYGYYPIAHEFKTLMYQAIVD